MSLVCPLLGHDRKEQPDVIYRAMYLNSSSPWLTVNSNQTICHITVWCIFTDMAITTCILIVFGDSSQRMRNGHFHPVSSFPSMDGGLHPSLISKIWHMRIKLLLQVQKQSLYSESFACSFGRNREMRNCSFSFIHSAWLCPLFQMSSM